MFGEEATDDPIDMLPKPTWQSQIQDPAQEAFQFPFQFPSQDLSGGEGGQYAPVDVPENLLQEAGGSGLLVDENAKETGESLTEQQGILGDIVLPELVEDTSRMMDAENASSSMVGGNDEGGMMATPELTSEEIADVGKKARQPDLAFGDLRQPSDVDSMSNNIEGGLMGDMYGDFTAPPPSLAMQAQSMMNPQGEAPSDEAIPGTVEQMYGETPMQQANRMMNPQMETPSDAPILPPPMFGSTVGTTPQTEDDTDTPFTPDVNKTLLRNLWDYFEQDSLTNDYGLIGEMFQRADPDKNFLENAVMLLSQQAERESPVTNQAKTMEATGADKSAASIATGKIIEAAGLDVLPTVSLMDFSI
jgi:hypothetical protein